MSAEELHDVLARQMRAVYGEFPDLVLQKGERGQFSITGEVSFRVEMDGRQVEDSYQIDVSIPPDYPWSVPAVKEVGGRIPSNFHTYSDSGALCLGAPLAVKIDFAKHRSLLGYIREQLVPYLFSHSFKERYGKMPFGELPHGGEGILQYYKELFGLQNVGAVLGLLGILVDESYRGHHPCPCNSGQKLRRCHGRVLLTIKEHQDQDGFLMDFLRILEHVKGDNDITEFYSVLPSRLTTASRRKRRKGRFQSDA